MTHSLLRDRPRPNGLGAVPVEAPDNISAAALEVAVGGTGALSGGKTTPLLTPDEGVQAMVKSGTVDYQAPG